MSLEPQLDRYHRFFAILDLSDQADYEQVEEAYRRLKGLYSVDKEALYSLGTTPSIEDSLRDIEEAYTQLRRKFIGQVEGEFDRGRVREPISRPLRLFASASRKESVKAKLLELFSNDEEFGTGRQFRQICDVVCVDRFELQDQTKVSVEYLDSIAKEDYNRLPQAVYVKGFIVSCLQYMGIDRAQAFAKRYLARMELWNSQRQG